MSDAVVDVSIKNRLAELGMTAAAEKIESDQKMIRSLRFAYEHYRFIEPGAVSRFNNKLRTEAQELGKPTMKQLKWTALAKYPGVPPVAVLDALSTAIEHKCFD